MFENLWKYIGDIKSCSICMLTVPINTFLESPTQDKIFIILWDYLCWKSRTGIRKSLEEYSYDPIYPTPPLGQDMTQGQFLSGV